jgi:hypothetical protein
MFPQLFASFKEGTTRRKEARRRDAFRKNRKYAAAATALALCSTMILPAATLAVPQNVKRTAVTSTPAIPSTITSEPSTQKTTTATTSGTQQTTTQQGVPQKIQTPKKVTPAPAPPSTGFAAGVPYYPTQRSVESARTVNVTALAKQQALEPSTDVPTEIRAYNPVKGEPPAHSHVPVALPAGEVNTVTSVSPEAPPPSATGTSPVPSKTFKGQFLSSTTIPPDTHGAVGPNHIVTSSNDFIRLQTRDGVELARFTINSFWSVATIKGVAVASAFDTKVLYDRFNDRFILVSSLNGPGTNSGMGVAVTQTGDPTGSWFLYTAASDPTSTTTGHAIDYPSVGFNKNWIVVSENAFNFSGSSFTSYFGIQEFILDKQAAYNNTVSSFSEFDAPVSTCLGDATDATNLGCGFTVVPSVNEENTTDNIYIIEDWDNVNGQLRVGKITGTPSTPVITEGLQFPQSPFSWQFNAARIGTANNCGGTCSGGYTPQRQQSANLPSSQRIAGNDSRIQNVVYRNGSLWTTHHVMVGATPTPAGTGFGTTNPDQHTAIQWWQIDPTVETGLPSTPTQRARIEDPTADNCHNGAGGTRAVAPCNGTTANQFGQFYDYPNIAVNKNNDVLIGFTQHSPLTYPSSAYAVRLNTDPPNTTRDPVIFRPGQANYNIGSGSGTSRSNRWGDYSHAMTDPVDDTTFWTVQEYAGTVRDFGIGLAGNWETWWAQVSPSATTPVRTGGLIISEFRLRGPQGARDEFVELYNPSSSPIIVNTTDNSEGWALASNNGTTTTVFAMIPNGTVIPAFGHFLVADNPDGANGPTVVYSLNTYPANQVRGADSDTGWSLDIGDTSGIAIFKTATTANFSAATELDAVGPATLPAGSLFKEGTGLGPLPTTNLQYTLFRNTQSGTPQDTNNNANDFVFGDTSGTSQPGLGQLLAAPGPENLSSGIQRNATVPGFLLDQTVSSTLPPNRVRDLTSNPGNNSTFGTLSIRRRLTNNTGVPITKLRFRVISITTFPTSGPYADVRALTSTDVVVSGVNDSATCSSTGTPTSTPCQVTAKGLTLETPPAQSNGGGWNSTLAAGSITLTAPLANGASVDVNFLLGVQTTGQFRFFVNIEAVP